MKKCFRRTKKWVSLLLCAVLLFGVLPAPKVQAAAGEGLSYPAQLVRFTAYGGKRNLNITGYGNGSALNTWTTNGSQNENWRIDFVQDGVFQIVNEETGKLVSVENHVPAKNAKCTIADANGSNSQKWFITGVEQDFLGNDLYYKIANYENPNLVISHNTSTNAITLKTYTGANNQKWKINCDGLEGFAANCIVSEGEKAGTIGGLFGETVFVSNLAQLKNALLDKKPLTIVITENIDNCNDEMYDLRIEDNKTLIGSYRANRLTDPRLRTDDYFQQEDVSDNIILKNIHFYIANRDSVVAFAVYGSRNIWVDHCNFDCSLGLYYDEVGKFIWVNRSNYANMDPDFVSLSYNRFTHRFWGVAFGAMYTNENRASVMYNRFESVVHRAPQLGNGTLHVYNNYYLRNDATLYHDGYSSIKCGAGSQVYSDSNRFENYQKELSGYWDDEISVDREATFKDVGSYTNKGETPVQNPYPLVPPNSAVTSWNPAQNYGYKLVKAYGMNDISQFCNGNTGTVSALHQLSYIHYATNSHYIDSNIASPVEFDFSDPDNDGDDVSEGGLVNNGIYMIQNVNSELYLDVDSGRAENGTNVHQWGASQAAPYNTWRIVSVGDGYYKLYSQVGDGNTFLLDLTNGDTSSGANIRIWEDTFSDAQVFKLQLYSDGSYGILSKVTQNNSGLDVESASTSPGGNVQQWGYNESAHQRWIFKPVN